MSEDRKLPGEFLEKLIIKGMMLDPQYTVTVSSSFNKNYFDEDVPGKIFNSIWEYYQEYAKLPPREVLIQQSKQPDKIQDFFQEIDSIDFDVAENYDYLFTETNKYLKEQAVKDAIMKGVDVVDKGDDPNIIRSHIEEALTKDLKVDLGTDYWDTLKERLTRILSQTDIRIPTFYPIFDEFISGGFPPYTLNVILARIHSGKCVGGDTKITIRNTKNNTTKNTRIQDFFINIIEEGYNMPGLDNFIKKHGEKEGKRKYDEWRKKVSESSKNRGTREWYVKKYGEEKGNKLYNEISRKISDAGKGRNTLPFFIEKYGEEEGKRKYDEWIEKKSKASKGINSLEFYQKKYGEEEGKRKFEEHIKRISEESKGRNTLPFFIEKYGEEEGKRRHKDYKNKMKFSNSRDGYIEKYGEEEGKRRWTEKCEKSSNNTLEFYQKKHGEVEGKKKFEIRKSEWLKKMGENKDSFEYKKKFTLENFIRKYGEEEGKEKYEGSLLKRRKNWSKKRLKKLSVDDSPQINNNGKIECKCAYCGVYFEPTTLQLSNRIWALNNESRDGTEQRLYCSQNCKDNCPIYRRRIWPKGYKPSTSREVQPQLRQFVFERDNYTCQKCDLHKDELEVGLHCHHKYPLNENPIESADMDTCITLCEDCHKWIHQNVPSCGYGEMGCNE